jgi:hypothetical protein
VWLGNIAADTGVVGDTHVVDPSSAANGLAFDVISGSPEQFLIAYSVGNTIRFVNADLSGTVGSFHSILQTEQASARLPLSVASAPGASMREHPLYMIAYTSLEGGSQPRVAAQAVDEHGEPFGTPVFPTQLPSHAAAVAYDPGSDLFAMTWIGPDSPTAPSDNLLNVAFMSCPP